MRPSLSCSVLASSLTLLSLAPAGCSSSGSPSSGATVDAPACAGKNTLVLDGTVDGKSVSQTLTSTGSMLNQLKDPKQLQVTFAGGQLTLEWASLVADGATTTLSSAVVHLPGETADRTAQSGVMLLGTSDVQASLTFPTGKIGLCLNNAH